MTKLLTLLLCILSTLVAFLGGTYYGLNNKEPLRLPLLVDLNTKDMFSPARSLYNTIATNYYGFSGGTQERITQGILQGMVDSIGDKHSVYFNPEETINFNNAIHQNFEGIGAYVGKSASGVIIHQVFSTSPAEKAGLKKWDIIVSASGVNLVWLTVERAVSYIKGPQWTSVEIEIIPAIDIKKITLLKIVRQSVDIPSTTHRMEGKNIGYIWVWLFGERTPEEFSKALIAVTGSGAKSLIIDMRDNPGGLLTGAISLLENFTKKWDLLVETRWVKSTLNEKIFSSQEPNFKGKIVVLINKNSASAAEIFAGALSDLKLATLIGEKSYGKWSVQEIFPLWTYWETKLTIAKWYTPLGKGIDWVGIKPDIEKIFTKDDFEKEQDPVIKEAINFLKK